MLTALKKSVRPIIERSVVYLINPENAFPEDKAIININLRLESSMPLPRYVLNDIGIRAPALRERIITAATV